ncbi:MAG: ATPase, partial [Deltaproteobacteria bacterium]|nr:ATPase [Deltaproteobacteria bacterium]
FHCMDKWGALEFPKAFGASKRPEEARVEAIDAKTGASLKLSVLNPDGRIWLMIAGGGASVIYADTVVDLGYMKELANYGEYSGNPSTEDTYEYTKTILDLMTRKADPKGRHKYLIIGGGIANFTDVASTFTGVINAIDEYADALKKVNAKIFVRRGGPNYKTGLAMMKKLGERLGIPMEVYGPDLHMTRVVKLALEEE